METAISGRDTIANFDTVVGTDAGDEFLGRDDGSGRLVGSSEPFPATMERILFGEQFIDGIGADTVDLRGGQGIVTLSADGVVEADLRAEGGGGLTTTAWISAVQSLTRVFFDDNGDGDYTPEDDVPIELVGTIQSTGIDAEAFLVS